MVVRKSARRQSDAELRQSIDTLRPKVVKAEAEVDRALSAFREARKQLRPLQRAMKRLEEEARKRELSSLSDADLTHNIERAAEVNRKLWRQLRREEQRREAQRPPPSAMRDITPPPARLPRIARR